MLPNRQPKVNWLMINCMECGKPFQRANDTTAMPLNQSFCGVTGCKKPVLCADCIKGHFDKYHLVKKEAIA